MDKEDIKASNKRFNYGLRRISDRLFYARIKARLAPEEVAKIRNVSIKTVRRWETRAGKPKNQKLIMDLAEIYNISYPWLSFHFGSEEHNFEQGFELGLIENIWHELDREKQKEIMIYIQKLME